MTSTHELATIKTSRPAILVGGIRNGMQWATCTQHGPFAVAAGHDIACGSCPVDTPAIVR